MPTATDDLNRIASVIRLKRAERGWRQRELAASADVALRTIQNIESGTRSAEDSTYGRIARALDIPLTQLLGEEA